MKHTVLMPFSRFKNIKTLNEGMDGQGVEWVPLIDGKPWQGTILNWIKPWGVDSLPRDDHGLPTINPGHWLCNAFLDAAPPEFFARDHYVSFITDDCLWCHNHWRRLQAHFKGSPALVMCATLGPGGNLIPAVYGRSGKMWENNTCRCFVTRFEALTVRADLLKDVRFGSAWCADGLLIERLCEENYGSIAFANDTCVYFNALQPEQWGFPKDRI